MNSINKGTMTSPDDDRNGPGSAPGLPPPVPALRADCAAGVLAQMRIRHSRIDEVMTDLNSLIYPGSQSSIFLVCGPTGVGKSTLARLLVESALKAAKVEMSANAGIVPAVFAEAAMSGEEEFSWRLLYQEILAALEGEAGMPKAAYGIDEIGRMVRPRGPTNNGLAALRAGVERALRARQTHVVALDEAAHLINGANAKRRKIQFDTVKSLANRSGAQMMLVGSYDLYPFVTQSAQLARRTHVLHFSRYRQDSEDDIAAFHGCVQKFQNAVPELWGERLMRYADALHENTLGCVGILSDVLVRAAMLAKAQGGWSREVLQRSLLNEDQRRRILEEILDGESLIDGSLTRRFHIGKMDAAKKDGRKNTGKKGGRLAPGAAGDEGSPA